MLSNTVLSFIRTFVPIVVGFIVAWVQPFGIDVDTETAISLLTAVAIGAYYTLGRLLERVNPKFGWLLGAPTQPVYHQPPASDAPADPRPFDA